jgi:hypothetical protein
MRKLQVTAFPENRLSLIKSLLLASRANIAGSINH